MPARHALISGGSSGIGLALGRRLAASGWNVTILARDPDRLAAAHRLIEAQARAGVQRFASFAADVTRASALETAVESAIEALGPPDLLVASAGIVVPGTIAALTADDYRQTMEVNYFGTLNLIRAALPAMRARPGGRIVLISSGAGLVGLYGYTSYSPTKFAVRGLAESLRSELAPEGIGVSLVYPPDTDTPQLVEELRSRPAPASAVAAGARVLKADVVADAILRGVAKGRFTIAPGWEMGLLARLHSLIAPALHRFWFDRVIARSLGRSSKERR